MRVLLNTNRASYSSIAGPSIAIPDLKVIQGLSNRWRKKNKPASNKIMDTIQCILDHLYFPTIKENTPLFFGVDFDENNKPKIGDGCKLEPFYLFITSLKLLKNADTSLQYHECIFHSDGTYKTNLNNFP